MSGLVSKCCCECTSIYRVFEPCSETNASVDVRRAATTVVALDNEYGSGGWPGTVYLYDGTCGCDAYCGTWVCDNRANVQDASGNYENICTAVPCDAATAAYPCPACTDTELPFINVRPLDLGSRFTEVDTDCCDLLCPTSCPSKPNVTSSDCGLWEHQEFVYIDPVLSTGGFTWTGLYGQIATFNVDSYQVVDSYEAAATSTSSFKSWLIKVNYTTSMDISNMSSGGLCTNGNNPNTSVSSHLYVSFLASPCSPNLNCSPTGVGVSTTISLMQDSMTTNYPYNGSTYNIFWGIACPNNNERIYFKLTGTNLFDPVPDRPCAQYERTATKWDHQKVQCSTPAGYPLGYDTAADCDQFSSSSAILRWTTSIRYPADPTP